MTTGKFLFLGLGFVGVVVVVVLGLLFWMGRGGKEDAGLKGYAVELKGKEWRATVSGQFTFPGVDEKEPIPILILDLAVENATGKEMGLDCVLVQSVDGGRTVGDLYYPFWALNIKRDEDLRVIKIPVGGKRTGRIAFELRPTDAALWLNCADEVRVRVQ